MDPSHPPCHLVDIQCNSFANICFRTADRQKDKDILITVCYLLFSCLTGYCKIVKLQKLGFY